MEDRMRLTYLIPKTGPGVRYKVLHEYAFMVVYDEERSGCVWRAGASMTLQISHFVMVTAFLTRSSLCNLALASSEPLSSLCGPHALNQLSAFFLG